LVHFLAIDFLAIDFLAIDFLAIDFLAIDFLAIDFLARRGPLSEASGVVKPTAAPGSRRNRSSSSRTLRSCVPAMRGIEVGAAVVIIAFGTLLLAGRDRSG
jgi:hypothetical protein